MWASSPALPIFSPHFPLFTPGLPHCSHTGLRHTHTELFSCQNICKYLLLFLKFIIPDLYTTGFFPSWSVWILLADCYIQSTPLRMEKMEPSCTVGGSVNWCIHYGEHYRDSLKTNSRATIWSYNALLSVYPEKIRVWKNTYTQWSLQHYLQ